MVESVLAARATSPSIKDSARTHPLSPARSNHSGWDGDFRRPTSPASRKSSRSKERTPTISQQATVSFAHLAKRSDSDAIQRSVTIDPVTQQIYDRTGETNPIVRQNSADTSFTLDENERSDKLPAPGLVARTDTGTSLRQAKSGGHKGVSFLSRIIGGNKKEQEQQEQSRDDASINDGGRPEGNDAAVFSPVLDQAELAAHQLHVPGYIRVRTRHSRRKHFDTLVLAQELAAEAHVPHHVVRRKSVMPEASTIWAAEFSKDGKYLATAGQDKIIRIWAVITSPEERHAEAQRAATLSPGSPAQHDMTAQVFKSQPIREYKGHTGAISDLSWSKHNFLLSASMDKTVRLWHITRHEALCTFKHADFVPAVAFHPKDDRFFLTGSLDRKLRLWSIPEKHVSFWVQLSEMITAVAFTPDGKSTLSGTSDGSLVFHETEGLKYQTQTRVRSAHAKHVKGSKITGIQTFQHPYGSSSGDTKILITSNDSRIRLYNFRDKALELKLKGVENGSAQIRASLSDDQRYILSGSEDNRAYIWPVDSQAEDDLGRRRLEHFQAHDGPVTCVRMAPTKTRLLIARSGDPIYDLCDPPTARPPLDTRSSSRSSSRPATDGGDSFDPGEKLRRIDSSTINLAASARTHADGNIIVTTSLSGAIKVFRQDCAAAQRVSRSSHGKRLSSMTFHSRPGSLKTKSSNQSLYSGRQSTSTQAPSERIMSWRQSIGTTASSSVRNGSISSRQSVRSVSPSRSAKNLRAVSGSSTATPRLNCAKTPTDSTTGSAAGTPDHSTQTSQHVTSDFAMTRITPSNPLAKARANESTTPTQTINPPTLRNSGSTSPDPARQVEAGAPGDDLISPTTTHPRRGTVVKHDVPAAQTASSPPPANPGAAEALAAAPNPLMLQGEQSDLFWNVDLHRETALRLRQNFAEADAARRAAEREQDVLDDAELWHDASETLQVPTGTHQQGAGDHSTRPTLLRPRTNETVVSRLSIERSPSPSTTAASSRRPSAIDGHGSP